jgi:alpha 1,2-mannosyltransferase
MLVRLKLLLSGSRAKRVRVALVALALVGAIYAFIVLFNGFALDHSRIYQGLVHHDHEKVVVKDITPTKVAITKEYSENTVTGVAKETGKMEEKKKEKETEKMEEKNKDKETGKKVETEKEKDTNFEVDADLLSKQQLKELENAEGDAAKDNDLDATIDYHSEFDPDEHPDWDTQMKESMEYINKAASEDKTLKKRSEYLSKVFHLMEQFSPKESPLTEYPNGKVGVQMAHADEQPYYTLEQLTKYLTVPDVTVSDLKKNHDAFLAGIENEYPTDIYETGSKGIVYTGGDRYSWLTLMSIMNLRQLGCTLPIEVLIPKYEEFELNICRDIFSRYNAKCIYLPRYVGQTVFDKHEFKGYQYKGLALALSSFENVLLLDADNTPLKNPEKVFTSEPFISHGLVTWPDFWKRSTHPAYYNIIDVNLENAARRNKGFTMYGKYAKPVAPEDTILLHQLEGTLPDPSTESGQMLFSKKQHFRSLLLSLYYNTYGPGYYYPLLSQGAAGEGDKETFIAAAHALGEKYYCVRKTLDAIGRFRNGDFHGSAMGQHDPVEDYALYEKYLDKYEENINERPGYIFLQANFPKLDPWSLYKDDVIIEKEADNKRNRLFGVGFIDTVHYDFELQTWENMKTLLCDEKLEFANFKNDNVETTRVCEEVLEQLEYLKKSVTEELR